jgi:ABC-type multidrug transport system fused ATPase/permease subunit
VDEQQLVDVFSRREITAQSESPIDQAVSALLQQWNLLLEETKSRAAEGRFPDAVGVALEDIRLAMKDLVEVREPIPKGKRILIPVNLPVISSSDREIIARQPTVDVIAAISVEIIPLYIKHIWNSGQSGRIHVLEMLPFSISIASYSAAKAFSRSTGGSGESLPESLKRLQSEANELRQQYQKDRIELRKESKLFSSFRDNAERDFLELQASMEESADNAVRAYLEAQKALQIVEGPAQVLQASSRTYRRRYYNGLMALSAGIVVSGLALWAAIRIVNDVFAFEKLETFSPRSAVALAVIVGAIAALGWILKIAGRMVTNSLALAEDYEMRGALTQAFLGFIKEEAVKPEDKTIMLTALFRPPGQGSGEDMEPITVIKLGKELAEAVKSGGSK